jgi:flavin reductase (DIM6/NTAB) family NADH-FMN oxidoreductase RutF
MFYSPENRQGLKHNPFKAIVAPRPIGWISTRGRLGDNLAPYSFFNAISDTPMQVMFAGGHKDSIRNVQSTGVFAVNLVSHDLLAQMNASSAALPLGVDEFAVAGVQKAECETIACPRVAQAPASLECRALQVLDLKGGDLMVIGEVTGIHINPQFLQNGRFDTAAAQLTARLGYRDYAVIERTFELARPQD